MSVLEVFTYPHPVLKKIAEPIQEVDDEIRKLAQDMLDTMYNAPGVGLAAPQVGKSIRLIVIDTRSRDENGEPTTEDMTELEQAVQYPLILINPEIVKKEGDIKWEEGCLSVPGYTEEVERARYIECKALNEKGEEVLIQSDGLLAVCIQHELDHLEGKVFIERLSTLKRNRLKTKIKKFGYPTTYNQDSEASQE